ncbi:MAG: transglycosylase domain-containing protein [Omnitrophica WOR_2 bacterium]
MKYRKIIILVCFLLFAGGCLAGYLWLFSGLPYLDALETSQVTPSIRIVDRNNRLLYEVLPQGEGRYQPVPLEVISTYIQQATISTEDTNFYQNPGVDLQGILRAAWINVRGGETLSGGSTITQQLARNLLLQPGERYQRSIRRKLRETWLAWQISRHYSKNKILELYLNQSYYGGMAYGVEAAAQTYFGKHASELDLAESALIAGLTQAPGRYNPLTDPQAAKKRQMVVLELLKKHGSITAEQQSLADSERLVYASTPYPIEAPHFVMMVRAELDRLLPPEVIQAGGLTVHTTLDLDWQHQAEAIIREQIETLDNPPGGVPGHNVNNAALVSLDPHTGEILALVGNPDYFDKKHSGAVNMALALCQPGSALKPIIYAAAFDPARARHWTAAQMILDIRTAFTTHNGQPYVPVNYDRLEHGPVSARQALASSLNIPAVTALDFAGLENTIQLAKKMGITTFEDPNQYDLSLALGGGAVKLLELTAAYATFDNHGNLVTPVDILSVTGPQDEVIYKPDAPLQPRVVDERVAWLVTDILSDDSARSIGFGTNSALKLDRPAAAKTGTTTNFHDNWTLGYTPDLVTGVWVGNADYQPMRDVTGLSGAGPIWHQFMRTILTGRPATQFQRPAGLVQVEVCALSGLLPTSACPYRKMEWFIQGTQPTQHDQVYQEVTIDTATGGLADANTPLGRRMEKVVLNLPAEAQPWAHSQGIALLSDYTGAGDIAVGGSTQPLSVLRLIAPDPGAIFHISQDLSTGQQRILIQAVGDVPFKQMTLLVDGSPVANLASSPFSAWWVLAPGEHQAWAEAVSADGKSLTSPVVTFTVK